MLLPLVLNLDTAGPAFKGSGNVLGLLFPLNMANLPTVVTIPPGDALLVKAVSVGFYNGIFRNIGDIFYIAPQDFEDASIDYAEGDTGYPEYGWMQLAPMGQVTASYSTAGLTAATQRRTVY